jgi:hypothetical protein
MFRSRRVFLRAARQLQSLAQQGITFDQTAMECAGADAYIDAFGSTVTCCYCCLLLLLIRHKQALGEQHAACIPQLQPESSALPGQHMELVQQC